MKVAHLPPVSRRSIIELWNQGDWGINQIALRFGLDEDDLELYLWRQPGFPDIIRKRTRRSRVEVLLRSYVNAQPHS